MKKQNKLFLIIIILSLILPLGLSPEPAGVFENLYAETSPVPPSLPDRSGIRMIAFFIAESEVEFRFSVALYDDPGTTREVDYMELYDEEGDLLLVSWIDSYGIRRMAVDRALLDEDDAGLERVLVFLTEGTPS